MREHRSEQLTVLDNGIKIATCTMPGVMSVSAMWQLAGGSTAELPQIAGAANGLAHVLEHCIADTERLARPLAERGGSFNALTSHDYIAMEMHVLAGSGMHMFRRLLQHGLREPDISATIARRELRRVKQELRDRHDDPDCRAYDRACAALFGDQPRGRPVGGSVKAVASLTPEVLTDYFNLVRQGQGLSIAVAGAVDHDHVVRSVSDVLGDLPRGTGLPIASSAFKSGEARVCERDSASAQVNVFFPGCRVGDKARPAYALANYLLGGGDLSHLYQELSHKRGYVYSVTSDCESWRDGGVVHISTSTAAISAQKLIDRLAISVCRDFPARLTPDHLQQAKMFAAFQYLSEPEGPSAWAERALEDLPRYGRVRSLHETVGAYGAVTLEELRDAARTITSRQPFVFAQGAVKKLELSEPFAEQLAKRPAL